MKRTVAFTISDRPHYLAETLRSWRDVRGLHDWSLWFFVEKTHRTDDQLKLLHEFRDSMGLKNMSVVLNPDRFGVLVNPWTALDRVFSEGAGFAMLAEEDLLVSTDVLEMMTFCSDWYSDDPEVLLVGGRGNGTADDPPEVLAREDGFSPHIWGTWSDRWVKHLRETWDKDYSTGNPDGSQAGWDWNIDKRLLPSLNMKVIAPRQSRSDHIGAVGTHMRPADLEASRPVSFCLSRPQMQYREI